MRACVSECVCLYVVVGAHESSFNVTDNSSRYFAFHHKHNRDRNNYDRDI